MEIKSLYTERELLRQVAAGNQWAFRVLYERYSKKVYTQASRLLRSDMLAEDILQEVFLKIWLMGDQLNGIENLEPFLRTLTRHRCLNTLRRLMLESKTEKELNRTYTETHNETEEAILLNDTRKILEAAIERLPEQQRTVYLLCHREGLKYEEAAERLHLSPLTVQTHMKRALKFLRKQVKENKNLPILLFLVKL